MKPSLIVLACVLLAACSRPSPGTASMRSARSTPADKIAAWVVDGQNSTGCASDNNNCTSATCGAAGVGPCLTITQIQQSRWGGDPILNQATTITGLSAYQPTDCWATNPIANGDAGSFAFAGTTPPFCTQSPNGFAIGGGGGGSSDGGNGNATSIQNVPVTLAAVSPSYVPVINAAGTAYVPRQLNQDDIAAGFSITGFSGSSTVEIGQTVTNPAFTASYSATPSSAQITNTDAIDSPLTLSSPYTSGTVVGTFSHSSQASTTFTLTAVGSSTRTATQAITSLPRVWTLSALAIATSGTVSGSSLVLNNSAGTAPSAGLFSSVVGQSYAFSPSGNAYLTIVRPHAGGTHSYKDQNGFTFPMTTSASAVAIVNQYGATVSEDIDQSTSLVAVATTVTVVQ